MGVVLGELDAEAPEAEEDEESEETEETEAGETENDKESSARPGKAGKASLPPLSRDGWGGVAVADVARFDASKARQGTAFCRQDTCACQNRISRGLSVLAYRTP